MSGWGASCADRSHAIVRVSLEGGALRVLSLAGGEVWSPAGRELAAGVLPGELLDSTVAQTRVLLLEASIGAECALLRLGRLPVFVAWSSEGHQLVLVGVLPGSLDNQQVIFLHRQ